MLAFDISKISNLIPNKRVHRDIFGKELRMDGVFYSSILNKPLVFAFKYKLT